MRSPARGPAHDSRSTVCEIRERIVAFAGRGGRRALIQQRVAELFSLARTAADQRIKLGVDQEMREALAARTDFPFRERVADLLTREGRAPQDALEHAAAGAEQLPVDLELPIVVREQCPHAWCSQRKQPANIFRPHEVPGRTHDVRAQDASTLECGFDLCVTATLDSLCDRPLGAVIVLRLHCAEPPGDRFRRTERGSNQALIAQSQSRDVGRLGQNAGAFHEADSRSNGHLKRGIHAASSLVDGHRGNAMRATTIGIGGTTRATRRGDNASAR